MNVRDYLISVRESFFKRVSDLYQEIAMNYGFPENPGMPLLPREVYKWDESKARTFLTDRKVQFPPQEIPTNYFEVLFGKIPKPDTVPRIFYESKTEGYYNFYIENFKNIWFLPNELSETLQIRYGFCLDIRFLEICQHALFLIIVLYITAITIRIFIAWMLTINPYTVPAIWVVSLVDWIEELALGLLPNVGGLSVGNSLLSVLIGKLGDSLNHLIFTMPYLPSEGVFGRIDIDGTTTNVLHFRYLPLLWYKYPIPNDIRYFWYTERPDILVYMQKAYEKLDIQFLPDQALVDLSSLGPGIIWKSIEDLSALSDFIN